MIEEQNIFDDSFLPAQLKAQSFKFAIVVSTVINVISILGILFIYLFNDPIGSWLILTVAMFVCFPLIIVQMLCLHKYLNSFQNSEKARYFMKYLITATFLLFVLYAGFDAEPYTIIICLIPQFLVGWQLVKINTNGDDFVGGFSFLGLAMCVSAILFPLIILIPAFVGYVFFKANRYAGL
jgi:hypothetical protein